MGEPIVLEDFKERVILVGVSEQDGDDAEDSLAELAELVKTAGASVAGTLIQKRELIHPGTYVGTGKVAEIAELLEHTGATGIAPAGFDMEIVEKHHNQKLDAPSGTALALADSMNDALGHVYEYKYDRSSERKKRDTHEIGISAVRGGSIVGEHEVIFAGLDEVIEFKHTAYSRSVFGKGAVEAAKFLAGKEAGFYDMQDVIRATMEQAD